MFAYPTFTKRLGRSSPPTSLELLLGGTATIYGRE